MNNIFKDLAINGVDNISFDKLSDVTINLQSAKADELVFYNLKESRDELDLFFKRLDRSKAKVVCVSSSDRLFLKDRKYKQDILVVKGNNFLVAQKRVMDCLYPMKKGAVKIVGVTGTNGKTSTVVLSAQVSKLINKRAVSVGTLGVIEEDGTIIKVEGTTTPSFIENRKIIFKYQDCMDIIYFEVSSHALSQKRLHGIMLDCAAWTSFSQDHLDYHLDMETYFSEKLKIINLLENKSSLVLPSREKKLKEMIKSEVLIAPQLDSEKLGNSFKVDFFRANLEVAVALNEELFGSIERKKIYDFNFELPRGRFNSFTFNSSIIIVDFAHTPDSLEKMIQAIKRSFKDYFITTLFGCGGDRDRDKRSIMGKVAFDNSDQIIITSDNTRTEDPWQIISDIEKEIKGKERIQVVIDRREAIKNAISSIKEKEILLIAGRGHEETWSFKGKEIQYCDLDAVKEQVRKRCD
jgi:UDP-N-acetylmuramoyl-L-alanyl-D-glutamate--2,6-diaminopimelate ligase